VHNECDAERPVVPKPPTAAVLLLALCATSAGQVPAGDPPTAAGGPTFAEWLAVVREEAIARGVRPDVAAAALDGVERIDVVLERDRAQAEFVLTLDGYLARRLSPTTVRSARQHYARHRALLRRVAARFGVEPHVLVAIWGLESNFGRFGGVRPTIPVLATLGYETRRAEFFRGQLIDALRILDRGDIELAQMKGSWAGAMGQPQFMPGSYLTYAVDFDGDGRRDIWSSHADVFGSIANYLSQNGWKKGERWGREVTISDKAAARITDTVALRESGCRATRELSAPLPLSHWRRLGVRLRNGGPLPRAALDASLLRAGPRSFLVYRNYDALLAYNCANSYGVSVGMLSDRIAGAGAPASRRKVR
jgi:membrane-bound lytic murein transglycosylase B